MAASVRILGIAVATALVTGVLVAAPGGPSRAAVEFSLHRARGEALMPWWQRLLEAFYYLPAKRL